MTLYRSLSVDLPVEMCSRTAATAVSRSNNNSNNPSDPQTISWTRPDALNGALFHSVNLALSFQVTLTASVIDSNAAVAAPAAAVAALATPWAPLPTLWRAAGVDMCWFGVSCDFHD